MSEVSINTTQRVALFSKQRLKSLKNWKAVLIMASPFYIATGWWLWEKALDLGLDAALGDEAELLQEELRTRTRNIEVGVSDLQSELEKISSMGDNSQELNQFVAKAEQLLEDLSGLQPALQATSNLSGDLTRGIAQAKQYELESTGSSSRPDFVLIEGAGIQLCEDRAAFGIESALNFSTISVNFSYRGKTTRDHGAFDPGEELSIETEGGLVTVAYIGPMAVSGSDNPAYGFNVVCS